MFIMEGVLVPATQEVEKLMPTTMTLIKVTAAAPTPGLRFMVMVKTIVLLMSGWLGLIVLQLVGPDLSTGPGRIFLQSDQR